MCGTRFPTSIVKEALRASDRGWDGEMRKSLGMILRVILREPDITAHPFFLYFTALVASWLSGQTICASKERTHCWMLAELIIDAILFGHPDWVCSTLIAGDDHSGCSLKQPLEQSLE